MLESAAESIIELGATNTLMISAGRKTYFVEGFGVNIRLATLEEIALLNSLHYVKGAILAERVWTWHPLTIRSYRKRLCRGTSSTGQIIW